MKRFFGSAQNDIEVGRNNALHCHYEESIDDEAIWEEWCSGEYSMLLALCPLPLPCPDCHGSTTASQ